MDHGGGVVLWLLPFVIVISPSTASAQSSVPPQTSSRLPAIQTGPSDYALFRFFFLNVLSVESFADTLKSSGKDDTAARSKFMREAKLTEGEAALLKASARRCTDELEAHERNEAAPTVRNLKARYPAASKASALPPEAAAQLAQLQRRHEMIVTDCVQGLRVAMGPERFQKLYEFVRGTEAPRIRQAPAPLPQKRQP